MSRITVFSTLQNFLTSCRIYPLPWNYYWQHHYIHMYMQTCYDTAKTELSYMLQLLQVT